MGELKKNKMAKSKLKTPEWILEGYNSEGEYNKKKGLAKLGKPKKGKTFKIRECPKCKSEDVGVLLTGEEGRGGEWKCRKCGWEGTNVKEKELSEEELIKHLEEKDKKRK